MIKVNDYIKEFTETAAITHDEVGREYYFGEEVVEAMKVLAETICDDIIPIELDGDDDYTKGYNEGVASALEFAKMIME